MCSGHRRVVAARPLEQIDAARRVPPGRTAQHGDAGPARATAGRGDGGTRGRGRGAGTPGRADAGLSTEYRVQKLSLGRNAV